MSSLAYCTCGTKFTVTDSRVRTFGAVESILRRRVCRFCGHRAHTIELPATLAKRVLALTETGLRT